jgi:hypothetical protein
LLELLVERFQPLMTISKLEGGAVFAYTARDVFVRSATCGTNGGGGIRSI